MSDSSDGIVSIFIFGLCIVIAIIVVSCEKKAADKVLNNPTVESCKEYIQYHELNQFGSRSVSDLCGNILYEDTKKRKPNDPTN